MEDKLKKIQQIRACKEENYKKIIITSTHQESVLNFLKSIGETAEDVEKEYEFVKEFKIDSDNIKEGKIDYHSFIISSQPDMPSYLDKGDDYLVRFKYQGVRDGKNRNFCAEVLGLNLLFRREDIDFLTATEANPEFGTYDIWKFAGSYGCRHNWFAQIYRRKLSPDKVQQDGTPVIEGIIKRGKE